MVSQLKTKLVIYTVLTGLKEPPGNPLARLPAGAQSDLEIDFVCFTDHPELISPVWTVRVLPPSFVTGEKASRLPKALPHRFFPDHDYSLYIDNIVEFKRLPQSQDLQGQAPYLFKMFKHAGRPNLLKEAEAIVGLGFDDVESITRQLDHYSQYLELEHISPLSTCTVMLRQHHHPQVQRLGELWWEQILSFSKRDQMSFDFVRLMTRTQVSYLEGSTKDNDLVFDQANLGGSRILANFDDSRYAHVNGLVGASRQALRQHYRALPPTFEASLFYARRNSLLDYHAAMNKSSLGHLVSPRRGLSHFLEKTLAPLAGADAAALALGLQARANAPLDWTEQEIVRAVQAMAPLLSGHRFTQAVFDRVGFDGTAHPLTRIQTMDPLGLLMLFNMGADQADKLSVLLQGLRLLEQGLVILFSDANTDSHWFTPLLQSMAPQPLRLTLKSMHSLHDLSGPILPASVHCIEWRLDTAPERQT